MALFLLRLIACGFLCESKTDYSQWTTVPLLIIRGGYILVDKLYPVKINGKNIAHFQNLNYVCSKGDEIYVKPQHLTNGCSIMVDVECDYCKRIRPVRYSSYVNNKKKTIINKDCCHDCQPLKSKEVFMIKYGVENLMQLDSYKKEFQQKIMDKYGVENVSQLQEVKDKKRETCLNHFGVDNYTKTKEYHDRINRLVFENGGLHPSQIKEVCEKRKATCLERYGVEFPTQSEVIRQKGITTNLQRYGCENVFSNEEIKNKIRETLFSHGNIATSSQQLQLYDMLKNEGYEVSLNYPVDKYSLDVALFYCNQKIDIEYDGWYWHQDRQKDYVRDDILINKYDWKVIRVKSGSFLPCIEDLVTAIDVVSNTDQELYSIILEDWKTNIKEENQYGKTSDFKN